LNAQPSKQRTPQQLQQLDRQREELVARNNARQNAWMDARIKLQDYDVAVATRDNALTYLRVNPHQARSSGLEKSVPEKSHYDKAPEDREFNIRRLSKFYNMARGLDEDNKTMFKLQDWDIWHKPAYGAVYAGMHPKITSMSAGYE
jgi:hypothetical protein